MTDDAALIERIPADRRADNGVPAEDLAEKRERATRIATEALGDVLVAVRTSPLGPGWSRDLDLHVRADPGSRRLRGLGWLPLDPLLHRLGFRGRGRWALVDRGEVLAGVDLDRGPPPDPVAAILARCRRRREVRAREVLELRALHRAGRDLPDDRVVRAAARAEAALRGDVLERWRDGPAEGPPVPLRSRPRRPRWARGGGRFLLAVSGVDGAGKSTLCRSIAGQLATAGVPVEVVWTRPGMRIGGLDRAARAVKRLLRRDPKPALATVMGEESAAPSRRGVVGWTWALLVTLAFLRDARRGGRRRRAVLVFDRHLLDALATLDVAYRGVRLAFHRALVRRLLPRADLSIYLDVPPGLASQRKPDAVFGEAAIRRQLEAYERWLREDPGVRRVDARRPTAEVAAEVLRLVTDGPR